MYKIAVRIARDEGLSPDSVEYEIIAIASLLHDVADWKVCVSVSVSA